MSEQTQVGHTKQDPTDVYIGRGPDGCNMLETDVGQRGWLGNPFTVDAQAYVQAEECENCPVRFELFEG